MKSPSSADDRGWFVYPRSDRSGFVLKYRVAPGTWREHRVPSEYASKRNAEHYGKTWLAERARQDGAATTTPVEPPPDRGPTIGELRKNWVKLRQADPALAPSTKHGDVSNLTTHIGPVFDDKTVADLTSGVLRPWLRDLRAKRAAFTVRNIANTLTTLLDDAMAEEWIYIPANPMRHPGVRKEIPEGIPRAGRNVILHISLQDAAALITCVDIPFDWRARYILMLTSGMRSGEGCGLAIRDVNLAAPIPTLEITKSLAEKGPDGWASLGRPKTPDAVRTLALHALAVPVLRAWLGAPWRQLVGRPPAPGDPLFPDAKGGWYRPDCARIFRGHLRLAGCSDEYKGRRLDYHATRRSFTTWLAAAGVQEGMIKRLLGHAGANVTQRSYTASVLTAMRDAVNTIDLGVTPAQVIGPEVPA